jgi:ribonuclease J
MIQAVKPKYFIPIHGEYRHLVLHAELADECKVEKSLVITNGEQVEVSEQAMHVIDEWGDLGTLIDGPARIEVANTVLSQRRKLAERGAVSVLVVMKDGRLVAEPRILSSGVFGGETVEKRISDATAVIKQVLRQATNKGVEGHAELEEMVRIELRRHFQNVFGKKSIVFPWVVEL